MTSIINWVKKYIIAVIIIGVVTAVITTPIVKGITILFKKTISYIACPIAINTLFILFIAGSFFVIIAYVKKIKTKIKIMIKKHQKYYQTTISCFGFVDTNWL